MSLETLSILGPSGCGKSMTLKCIAGIETPDSGEIILNDRILYSSEKNINLSPQKRNTGYLFQSYALFPNMTLYDNLKIALKDKSNTSRLNYYIDKFSLKGLENNYPDQLSGGQKQRVALARMIINDPDIFMLDEPFSAIDEYLKFELEEEVLNLIKEENIPTLFVSHDKNEVYRLSDTIAIMKDGSIIEKGNKTEIFTFPNKLYTAHLVGFKNISPLTKIDDNVFIADNWNIKLNLNTDAKYIGINENRLNFELDGDNIYKFKVEKVIPNFDHKIILLRENKKQKESIYIKISNGINIDIGDIIPISLDKPNINLFK